MPKPAAIAGTDDSRWWTSQDPERQLPLAYMQSLCSGWYAMGRMHPHANQAASPLRKPRILPSRSLPAPSPDHLCIEVAPSPQRWQIIQGGSARKTALWNPTTRPLKTLIRWPDPAVASPVEQEGEGRGDSTNHLCCGSSNGAD